MTDLEKAARQALEALYDSVSDNPEWIAKRERSVAALRRALEQPAQQRNDSEHSEPVAWWLPRHPHPDMVSRVRWSDECEPLYSRPQARELVEGKDYTLTQTGVGIGNYDAKSDERLMEMPAQDNTYGYAKTLAEAIFKQHFASDEHYASGRVVWGVFDTVEGILTQIDNMVADMVRKPKQPAQQKPVSLETVYETIIHWDEGGGKRSRRELARRIVDLYTSTPAQEPVGEVLNERGEVDWISFVPTVGTPLYTRPQAREPLTDEQLESIWAEFGLVMQPTRKAIARAIEAAHGIGEKK